MTSLRSHYLLMTLSLGLSATAQQAPPPQAEISNGLLHAVLSLPDAKTGFYRGTRFDWSGVIQSLAHDGHNYYGPWFTRTDPKVIDFVFDRNEIVAGPCSAITGPVEEFTTHGKALGFDDSKAGGKFIKIGVGVLRRPDAHDYNPYQLYDIVDPGKWHVETKPDSVEFSQELSDPSSGYAYRYTKIVRLVNGKPEMLLEHRLENTGKRTIESSVYDHNFLVLDSQPVGPDYVVTVPFDIQVRHPESPELTSVQAHQFTYLKNLTGHQTVAADLSGFGSQPSDYNIKVENKKAGAGIHIVGDRPLARVNLWSIRTVLAVEPFIDMSIEPGKEFTWSYTYTYYSTK